MAANNLYQRYDRFRVNALRLLTEEQLSARRAASLLGVSAGTVSRMIQDFRLEGFPTPRGRGWRTSRQAIERFRFQRLRIWQPPEE